MKKLIITILGIASIGGQLLSMTEAVVNLKVERAQQLVGVMNAVSLSDDDQKYFAHFDAISKSFAELLGSAETYDEYQQLFEIFHENISDLHTPLTAAARYGNIKIVAKLLKDGVSDKADKGGKTALIEAAWHGHKDSVELLIEAGFDLNYQMKNTQFTVLMYAATSGHKEVVELLLEKGADPTLKSINGYTAKDYTQKGYPEIAKLL